MSLYMFRTFSLTMLITCMLLASSCKSTYIASVNFQNTSVDENINSVDSNLVLAYLPYKTKIDKEMNRLISESETNMVKNKPESGLTNLLADLLLAEGNDEAKIDNLELVCDVSFFNYGGIRTGLPKGNITVGKVFELMPFENEMVFLQLTGMQLRQFCDLIAQSGGGSVGGLRFTISDGKAKNVVVGGNPIQPENKYWMVTNDYAANGGDDLSILRERLVLKSSGFKIRDAIIRNFEKQQKEGVTLKANLDGRIGNE